MKLSCDFIFALLFVFGIGRALIIPTQPHAHPSNEQPHTQRISPRIYCAVPGLYEHVKAKHDVIVKTWGKRCDKLKFLVGGVPPGHAHNLPKDFQQINTTRQPGDRICSDGKPCRNLWEQIWRSWLWISIKDIEKADFFFKIDADTFFFPENAKHFITQQQWSPQDPRYFGHVLRHLAHPMVAGALEGLSQAGLRQLGEVLKKMPSNEVAQRGRCEDRYGAEEDSTTAICLHGIGINPEETVDERGRERILLFQPPAHLSISKRHGWYWENKPKSRGVLEDCCSPFPMGFHSVKTDAGLVDFEMLLYGDGNPSVLETGKSLVLKSAKLDFGDEVLRQTRAYFTKVQLNLRQAGAPDERRYLTYERSPGQMGNQLFQLVSAIQHAHHLKRILIIPPEHRKEDWTGMFQPSLEIWNLTSLRRAYNVEFYNDEEHKELLNGRGDERSDCYAQSGELSRILLEVTSQNNSYEHCRVLNLRDTLMSSQQQHRFSGNPAEERLAYEVYQHLSLHSKLAEQLPKEHFKVGVHSRTHGMDRYTGNGDSGICTRGVAKTINQHIQAPIPDNVLNAALAQCALWETGALNAQTGLALTGFNSTQESALRFLLVHDGAHQWKKTYWKNVYEFNPVGNANTNFTQQLTHYKITENDVERVSKSLLHLFAVAQSDFFVGNLYSTFSLAVCMLRGEARKADSNICETMMHPGLTVRHARTNLELRTSFFLSTEGHII